MNEDAQGHEQARQRLLVPPAPQGLTARGGLGLGGLLDGIGQVIEEVQPRALLQLAYR